jgi:C4-dicarboxylate-specific signal transduction histidine kinase
MRDTLDTIAETGLQFFGKMTASISHEIKNILAIINENAGLLEDITQMADRGKPIEAERLKTLSQAVMKQVGRADSIVKNMNRLAHSTDESLKAVDLNDTLELVLVLSDRFASMRGVTLETKLQRNLVKIRTFPFLLMNLIWLCLDFAMDAAGDDKIVELATQKTETGANIQFRRLKGLAQSPLDKFPADRERRLLDKLRAEFVVKVESKELVVQLATDIDRD